jgi:lipopolysaccharide transport system permease protein
MDVSPSVMRTTTDAVKWRTLLSPVTVARTMYRHRRLIGQFAWRDVVAKYKGSYLGLLWSLVVPLMMLAIYGFFFGVIMTPKYGSASPTGVQFALWLFCGLVAFNIFSEVVGRAPVLVVGYPAYVKKVVFPLEILPIAALGTALANAAFWLVILVAGWAIAEHTVSATIWMLPIAVIPLCFISLGLAWFIASLGVFIRDLSQAMGLVIQILIFLSGVFFAISALPPMMQKVLLLNPLVTILDNFRRVAIWGEPLHWRSWGIATVCGLVLMQLGYAWFMRTKKAFADVI